VFKRIRSKLSDIVRGAAPPALSQSEAAVAPALVVKKREPAPVMVYFEKDRNQRLIERVRELLTVKGIAFQALDVSGDAATIAFVVREAHCEDDDLPIVFVAGTPVGGYNELVDWDVSGRLKTAVFGE
jgi:glutaredoxin